MTIRTVFGRSVGLLVSYALALQTMFAAFSVPAHTMPPLVSLAAVCASKAADESDGPRPATTHDICMACVAGACGHDAAACRHDTTAVVWLPMAGVADLIRPVVIVSAHTIGATPQLPRAPPVA